MRASKAPAGDASSPLETLYIPSYTRSNRLRIESMSMGRQHADWPLVPLAMLVSSDTHEKPHATGLPSPVTASLRL